jgi:hypothetical protein
VFPESRLDASIGCSPMVALREWLGGHWAILFSRPGDFDHEQLERDRRALRELMAPPPTRKVRPIGFTAELDPAKWQRYWPRA